MYFKKSLVKSYLQGIVVLSLSIILLVLYTITFSHDYPSYLLFHSEIQNFDSLTELLNNSRFEVGFVTISYYLASFLSGNSYFILLASISLIIKYTLFKKYINTPNFAWLLYVVIFLPALEASQIRSAIATIVLLYIILREVPKERLLFPTILASVFHYSGFIILFFYLQRNLIISLIAILVFLLLSVNFDIILTIFHTDFLPFNQFISTTYSEGVNLFSSIFISQFFISLIGMLNWNRLNRNQRKGLFLIIVGTIVYIGFYYNPGIAHRIREISLLGIFPLLFSSKIRMNHSLWAMYLCISYIVSYSIFHTLLRLYNFYW